MTAIISAVDLHPFLEPSPDKTDDGALIGRDPREIPAVEWSGVTRLTGLRAIRSKCLDCACSVSEVRKCTCTVCPLWPYRLGSVPKGLREASP